MRMALHGMWAGVKNGNPMMWSQWTWDMKMLKRCLREGPCSASTRLPNSRAPVPRSQSTYSAPPVAISTQLELPPKVPLTEKGSSRSMKVSSASAGSNRRPLAATSAARILRLSATWPSGAGSEPRVPQKRTTIGPDAEGACRRLDGAGAGRRAAGLPGGQRRLDIGEDRENVGEAADLEDLLDEGIERRHR